MIINCLLFIIGQTNLTWTSSAARSNIGGIAKGMKLGGGQAGKKKESTLDALMAEDKVVYSTFRRVDTSLRVHVNEC